MTDKQPEALRLADVVDRLGIGDDVAVELRRLDQSEREGWRYADELEQERKRLDALNAELVEVLREIMSWEENEEMVWAERAKAALRKAQGENNE